MWKSEHRHAADRSSLRYPSDLSDAEWAIVEPMIPPTDVGKNVKGRKRHILVDTLGLLPNVVVHPADIQDRDGAFDLLRRARRLFPFIERIFADGGYRGEKMALMVARTGSWTLRKISPAWA
jgi:transposase